MESFKVGPNEDTMSHGTKSILIRLELQVLVPGHSTQDVYFLDFWVENEAERTECQHPQWIHQSLEESRGSCRGFITLYIV